MWRIKRRSIQKNTKTRKILFITLVSNIVYFVFIDINRELRLIEAITAACRTLLDYEVHPKRPGSRRYSKDPNPAIKVLKDIK